MVVAVAEGLTTALEKVTVILLVVAVAATREGGLGSLTVILTAADSAERPLLSVALAVN